jgi:hypothetical protein
MCVSVSDLAATERAGVSSESMELLRGFCGASREHWQGICGALPKTGEKN